MGHRTIEHQEMWWKITFWIFNMQFRERSQKFFGQRPSVCRSNNEKDERTFFWTTLFPSKCSSGLPEQKFGCLAAFLPKIQNFFLLWFRIFLKNTSLFERIFLLSKLSSALEESSFDKLSKKSLLEVGNWQNRSSDIKKCDEKHLPGLLLWKLENADKQSRQRLSVYRSKFEKDESIFILSNNVFLKMFFWANRLDFWQSCRYFLPKI